MKKQFSIAQILSVTTGILCTHDFGDIYSILNFMTGESLYTHALLRAADEAAPYLCQQHPFLAAITADELRGAGYITRIPQLIAQYGEFHECYPIPRDDREQLSVTEELDRLGFTGEVIQVDLAVDDEPEPSDIGDINWKVD